MNTNRLLILLVLLVVLASCTTTILRLPGGGYVVQVVGYPAVVPHTTNTPTSPPQATATATIPWIDPTPTGETIQPPQVCNAGANTINLRAGAGASYSKVGVLQPGECVTWLDTGVGEGGNWHWVCIGWSPGSCASTAYVASWVTDLRN